MTAQNAEAVRDVVSIPASARRPRRPRRWFRRIGIAVILVVVTGAVAGAIWWFTSPIDTVGEVAFTRPLPIPPLAESRIDADGNRVFDLTAKAGAAELVPGGRAATWGFNGDYLGPTLRARAGEQVKVNVRNTLGEPTTVHWHGMHLPAEMDGGPHQMVAPDATWSPSWQIDQQPATLWYHPHPHGKTEDQVYRGLAGIFLIDDPDDPSSRQLPHDYGVDDIPVIVQDKRFDDGRLDAARFGDTILVNGGYGPYLDVTTEAVRLRLLNASTARVYEFGLSDDHAFDLVGTDGGLLPEPDTRERLRLSPGERAEVVVRLRPGQRTVLRSYPPDLGMNTFQSAFVGGRDRFDVLQLRAAAKLTPSPQLPQRLVAAPDLDDTLGDVTRRFDLQGRKINGEAMDMSRVDEAVTLGTTETWQVANTDDTHHNFHVHDVQFQVLDVDGRPPPAELGGWKDTIFVAPGSTVRIAVRFTDYADPDTPYMYHCHLLQHEDRGMMGQFVVVKPGHAPGTPAGTQHHDHQHDGSS